jgi:hypothetical protein
VSFARNACTGLRRVPAQALRAFAKRGASIEALLTDLRFDPGEASRAVQWVAEQRTRGARTEAAAAPDATLRELWQAEARAGGWDRTRRRSRGGCSTAAGRTGRTTWTGQGIRTRVRPLPARKASLRWRAQLADPGHGLVEVVQRAVPTASWATARADNVGSSTMAATSVTTRRSTAAGSSRHARRA